MSILGFERILRSKKIPDAASCIVKFLSLPEHGWIRSNPKLLDRIAGFLSLISAGDLKEILQDRKLLLLYCNQKMSCAFHQFSGREIVLIFPELLRLLESAQYLEAYAILAHELGHVAKGHSRKAVSPLLAQVEADQYAAELGLGEELFRVLGNESSSEEVRLRLSALKKISNR